MLEGHDCDQNYCSQCHHDQVRNARARGYRQGQLALIGWALARKPRLTKWDLHDARNRLLKGGSLEETDAD